MRFKLPDAKVAQLEVSVDQQIRELERLSAGDDKEAQHKLDRIRLRTGKTPGWSFLLEESVRVIELQKTHLFKAIDARFRAFFEKHSNSGILGFSWSIYDRPDCGDYNYTPDNWDIEGLQIDIDGGYWDEFCQITDYRDDEFEASTLVSHLKDICDCSRGMVMRNGEIVKQEPVCFVGKFEWLEDKKKHALSSALEDAMKIYEMLDQTERRLIRTSHIDFIFRPKEGLMSRERIGEQHKYHS